MQPAIERLVKVARELEDRYPSFRDDPSEEDLAAWSELRAALSEVESKAPKTVLKAWKPGDGVGVRWGIR